ncbi:hypothetical protein A4R26_13295 [Niastella populi]|uniref:Uncharacterized protein n=1 Tax=Niastella populi TaxID=550983 RepID=A0A1V9G7W3_9BACT|nr:hypothetical protein A4R26_13295 [Niastella populi]
MFTAEGDIARREKGCGSPAKSTQMNEVRLSDKQAQPALYTNLPLGLHRKAGAPVQFGCNSSAIIEQLLPY